MRSISGTATGFLSSSHFPPENNGNFLICNAIGVLGVLQHKVEYSGADINAVEIEPKIADREPGVRTRFEPERRYVRLDGRGDTARVEHDDLIRDVGLQRCAAGIQCDLRDVIRLVEQHGLPSLGIDRKPARPQAMTIDREGRDLDDAGQGAFVRNFDAIAVG